MYIFWSVLRVSISWCCNPCSSLTTFNEKCFTTIHPLPSSSVSWAKQTFDVASSGHCVFLLLLSYREKEAVSIDVLPPVAARLPRRCPPATFSSQVCGECVYFAIFIYTSFRQVVSSGLRDAIREEPARCHDARPMGGGGKLITDYTRFGFSLL